MSTFLFCDRQIGLNALFFFLVFSLSSRITEFLLLLPLPCLGQFFKVSQPCRFSLCSLCFSTDILGLFNLDRHALTS